MSNIQNQGLFQISEIEINGTLTKTVNARDLHSFLESKQDFSTWIKNRIEKYDFILRLKEKHIPLKKLATNQAFQQTELEELQIDTI